MHDNFVLLIEGLVMPRGSKGPRALLWYVIEDGGHGVVIVNAKSGAGAMKAFMAAAASPFTVRRASVDDALVLPKLQDMGGVVVETDVVLPVVEVDPA